MYWRPQTRTYNSFGPVRGRSCFRPPARYSRGGAVGHWQAWRLDATQVAYGIRDARISNSEERRTRLCIWEYHDCTASQGDSLPVTCWLDPFFFTTQGFNSCV